MQAKFDAKVGKYHVVDCSGPGTPVCPICAEINAIYGDGSIVCPWILEKEKERQAVPSSTLPPLQK